MFRRAAERTMYLDVRASDDEVWRENEGRDDAQAQMRYWGFKFEEVLTGRPTGGAPAVVDANIEYAGVFAQAPLAASRPLRRRPVATRSSNRGRRHEPAPCWPGTRVSST